MYFLNSKEAINELQADLIDDRETLKYLFGLGVISGFGLPFFFISENEISGCLLDIVVFVVSLVALFVLLRKCYALNSQADGKKFLNRFLVLNFIISLRILVIYIGGSVVLSLSQFLIAAISARGHPPEDLPNTIVRSTIIMHMLVRPLFDVILVALWYFFLKKAFRLLTDGISLQTR